MNSYKQYKKIEPPYLSYEYLFFPVLPLLLIAVLSYISLYFFGLTFTSLLYVIGVLFMNAFYHALKHATPNGGGYKSTSIASLLPSYFFILFLLFFTNIGTYLFVIYQETNIFHATIFYIWLFIVLGFPIIYYAFKFATYYQLIYSQALQFTNVCIKINYDPEFLIKIDEIHFINYTKKRIAKYTLKKNREFESQKTLESLNIAKRNEILFSPAFSERMYVPVNTNLVKIAYYSISEDTYYQDEIVFPYDQLIFEENKYPLNKSKILRGKKTEPLSITIHENGKIKIFTGSELLLETTLKKDNLKTENSSEYKEIIEPYQNRKTSSTLLLDNETRERIKTRQEIREKPFNWTLNLNLSHNHLICVYDCNNKESLRSRFTDIETKQSILQNSLPRKILFYCDTFNRTKWLEIAIDTEKLYKILNEKKCTYFEINLTIDIQDSLILLELKIDNQFIEFPYWEKTIIHDSLLDIQLKIKEKKKIEQKNVVYSKIYELMQKKEYSKAEELCKKSIKENPTDGMLYFYEARLLFYIHGKKACYDKEAYFIERTSHDTKALAHIYNNYGCLLDEDLDYKKALSYFEKANELAPEMAIYVANKAEIHYKLKNRKKAISFAKEAQEKGDTSEIVKEILKK
ncbi:hypothetical protein FIA58_013200 [Flavobacterium jejuense]|uniref:Uncharacterized protein n=1 Tax=Flavobacterium jejuense TaxID=1544455 RepID=A0ABX0IX53_9FLAO|nr:hypothetical protein [Flavobacterium jejuense]NHN26636.1 hypothetical protein [Flavobacterium jejuense]